MKWLLGRGKAANWVSAMLLVGWVLIVSMAAESIDSTRDTGAGAGAAETRVETFLRDQLPGFCAAPAREDAAPFSLPAQARLES